MEGRRRGAYENQYSCIMYDSMIPLLPTNPRKFRAVEGFRVDDVHFLGVLALMAEVFAAW